MCLQDKLLNLIFFSEKRNLQRLELCPWLELQKNIPLFSNFLVLLTYGI